MPEFKDETKRKELIADMTKKAKKHYDLTDDQISTVQTAEEVRILNDALKWRELQSNKPTAKKKAEGVKGLQVCSGLKCMRLPISGGVPPWSPAPPTYTGRDGAERKFAHFMLTSK